MIGRSKRGHFDGASFWGNVEAKLTHLSVIGSLPISQALASITEVGDDSKFYQPNEGYLQLYACILNYRAPSSAEMKDSASHDDGVN